MLFGLIMTLTFTCTLGVATADSIHVRAMLVAALGCNLAWGIIDGGVYLMARLSERGRAVINWRAVHDETNAGAVRRSRRPTWSPFVRSCSNCRHPHGPA